MTKIKFFLLYNVVFILVISCSQKKTNPLMEGELTDMRNKMVEQQIIARGIKDQAVINAMKKVPRHLFVPEHEQKYAYKDEARSIGQGQTISQPYIVAFMTEELHLKEGDRILEIGTGSGYQAAILSQIADTVYSIEIIEELAINAQIKIKELNYNNIIIRQGDGYLGWPEREPFDAIIVTAAPPTIPTLLLDQLKIGGRMVLPVGKYVQELVIVSKNESGHTMESVLPVRFVPMTGKIQEEVTNSDNQDE